ncbi:MAG: GAF domain-containing protein [Chloroflexi bacterium]|nr:GAF domain-containing protein [Chloroflexota bacterium]
MPELHREAEARSLERRLADLNALVDVLTEINRSLELDEVLRTSLAGIQRVVGGEFGCFLLIEPQTHTLELAHPTGLSTSLIESLQNLALHSGPPLEAAEPGDYKQILNRLGARVRETLLAHGAEFFALLPLTARGQAIGVLLAGMSPDRILAPPSIDLLMSIGEQVGMAIANARLHASVRESEAWHRTFIQDSPDGFVEGEFRGRITFINDAGCRILGLPREQILGRKFVEFAVNPDGLEPARMQISQEGSLSNWIAQVRTNGSVVQTLSLTIRLVDDNSGKVVRYQCIFRDISARQQLLETLRRRNHELDTLNAVSSILTRPLEIQSALDQICERIATLTGMETVTLYVIDESRQALVLMAHHGAMPSAIKNMRRLPLGDPFLQRIAVHGETVMLGDLSQVASPILDLARAAGYQAGVGVPISTRGQPVGAILIASHTPREYEASDIALLVNIGQRIGLAWENADLYAQMQRRVQELDGLAQLSAACSSTLELEAISNLAVEWTRRLLPAKVCSLRLLKGDSAPLTATAGAREGASFWDAPGLSDMVHSLIERRKPLVVGDSERDTKIAPATRAYCREQGVRALLSVPMPAPDRVVGILNVAREGPCEWSRREIDLLQTIANQAANSIANAQLFRQVLTEQRKVQAIFDSGLSGLYATDVSGRIVMFNRAAERMTGWMLHEVQGKPWEEVLAAPGQDPLASPLILSALSHASPAYRPEGGHLRTRDGRLIPVAEAVAPLLNEHGGITGAVGAFWDLTREREAELNREEFLRMVAHEMRNPLTALLSGLDLLENGRLDAQESAEMWKVVKAEGERLDKFAHQFLEMERQVQPALPVECVRVPVASILQKLVRDFRRVHPAHRFRLHKIPSDAAVLADPERMESVLRNLLDNAAAYSPPASQVQILVSQSPPLDRVDIAVRDRGPGIPPPEQARVFEPFYRIQRPGGQRVYGHGLGLYIARKLAREMGGDVEVASQVGRGSTFYLRLRRSE